MPHSNGGHMAPFPFHNATFHVVGVLVIGNSQMQYLNCLMVSKVCSYCNEASGRESKPMALEWGICPFRFFKYTHILNNAKMTIKIISNA